MRKIVTSLIVIIIGLGILVYSCTLNYPTAGTGKLNFTASPSTQGVGGTILMTLSAEFGGWCGTSVYSPFMEADLNLPEGLQLVRGDKKAVFPEVVIPPGKKRTTEVSWEVMVLEPGDYNVASTVTGKYDQRFNVKEEARQALCNIIAKDAPSVTRPELNKQSPDPQNDIEVSTLVKSNSPISDAMLFYTVKPEGIVTQIPMKRQGKTDSFSATIPKQNHNSIVKYWIDVSNIQGSHLETSKFEYQVIDPVKVNELPRSFIWVISIMSLAIFIIYLFLRKKVIGKLFTSPQIGVVPMGVNPVNINAVEQGKSEENLNRVRVIRQRYFLVYTIIAILFVLIGIFTDQFIDVAKQFQ